jgi:hypothetical protein
MIRTGGPFNLPYGWAGLLTSLSTYPAVAFGVEFSNRRVPCLRRAAFARLRWEAVPSVTAAFWLEANISALRSAVPQHVSYGDLAARMQDAAHPAFALHWFR